MANAKVAAIGAAILFTGGAVALSQFSVGGVEEVRYVPPISRASQIAEASVIFGGDMMFDRTIRAAMDREGDDYVFSCVAPILRNADLVVANLEGPITMQPSKSVGSVVGGAGNYTFTFPTSTATLLARHNIGVVSLGNNHIFNFGREGLTETKTWLDGAGMLYFGDPDVSLRERIERMQINGVHLSLINWSDWTSGAEEDTLAQVRTEALSGRIVIVYTHWGEEYVPPTSRVRDLAHALVDAGADIVIGSHPHIVQEHEIYNDAHIYYSLGNFIFDQYWNQEVRRGLLLRVTFAPTGVVSVEEIPIDAQTDRRTCAA